MNFLAHLYLSNNDPELMVGNMMGDFVKGSLALESYNVGIKAGVILHRKIDSFTDSHPLVMKTKNSFPKGQRRYAPIVLDMLYDHFLAKNWRRYSQIDLTVFTGRAYSTIANYESQFSPSFRSIFSHMQEHDWLASYQDLEVVHYALHRISFRLKNNFDLEGLLLDIQAKLPKFERDFICFFEDLRAYVAAETATIS